MHDTTHQHTENSKIIQRKNQMMTISSHPIHVQQNTASPPEVFVGYIGIQNKCKIDSSSFLK